MVWLVVDMSSYCFTGLLVGITFCNTFRITCFSPTACWWMHTIYYYASVLFIAACNRKTVFKAQCLLVIVKLSMLSYFIIYISNVCFKDYDILFPQPMHKIYIFSALCITWYLHYFHFIQYYALTSSLLYLYPCPISWLTTLKFKTGFKGAELSKKLYLRSNCSWRANI